MNFEQFSFDRPIVDAIKNAGYSIPTPIQQKAIPSILEGRDVLGLAQTGTGKTAAFMLPILQRLRKGKKKCLRALVLAPTRELAEQIREATDLLGKGSGIKCIAVYGGVSREKQINGIRKGAEIVIACPGRLLDIASDKTVNLSNIEVLVLDEADRMCDMGFLPDIRRILKILPKKRQTLFFSATMPYEIRHLSKNILQNPLNVQVDIIAPAKTVSHALYPVTRKLKKQLFFAILKEISGERVLVFTKTKFKAKNLARDLARKNHKAAALHGNMTQQQRQKAIKGFKNGNFDVLVATDIAARGLDISEISHVINFDIPENADAYTHRIGRTGRAKQSGMAYTLSLIEDEPLIREIEKLLKSSIERRSLDGFDYDGFKPEQEMSKDHLDPKKKKVRMTFRSSNMKSV